MHNIQSFFEKYKFREKNVNSSKLCFFADHLFFYQYLLMVNKPKALINATYRRQAGSFRANKYIHFIPKKFIFKKG